MSEQDDNFLTKSAFAKRQRWSRSYVSKLSSQGKLLLCPSNPKLIDVSASLKALGQSAAGRERLATAHSEPGAPSGDDKIVASPDSNYWTHKSRHEAALAKISEIELARKSGDLVDRRRVERTAFTTSRMLRDAILGVPTQLAPELALMTDSFQLESRLRDALRQVLADMAKMSVQDLEKAMEQDD